MGGQLQGYHFRPNSNFYVCSPDFFFGLNTYNLVSFQAKFQSTFFSHLSNPHYRCTGGCTKVNFYLFYLQNTKFREPKIENFSRNFFEQSCKKNRRIINKQLNHLKLVDSFWINSKYRLIPYYNQLVSILGGQGSKSELTNGFLDKSGPSWSRGPKRERRNDIITLAPKYNQRAENRVPK